MLRREFLIIFSIGGLGGIVFLFLPFITKRKIKDFIKSIAYHIKPIQKIPIERQSISVETALNSRCTSDHDGNPENFHWGMFDKTKKISKKDIKDIISQAIVPRFTDQQIEIRSKRNILTFIIQNREPDIIRDWLMVESGMQQQAVGLICAAMGVGMVFQNLGKDGRPVSNTDYQTINMLLGPMKPSYDGSYLSNSPPDSNRCPWKKGNLPAPVRDGKKNLFSTLAKLTIIKKNSSLATDESISQLLWAARGRTPHFYKSKPWGMTIPTWASIQDISSVYFISENKLFKYINWDNGSPTHALQYLTNIETNLFNKLLKIFSANRGLIVLGKNEDFARALWEVGYQLLNLLLQASSLGISYHAFLLDGTQKTVIGRMGVRNPVAILAI